MDSQKWNTAFTNMIRGNDASAWGNWTLDSTVKAGAVGIIDPSTGSFSFITDLPKSKIIQYVESDDWTIESSSVHRTETNIDFKGGYKDPSSGLEVKVGLDVGWKFGSENSISSNAVISGREVLDDYPLFLSDNYNWLLEQAQAANYVDDGGIVQGFGVITNVKLCSGGVNIASLSKDNSFSMKGSVDGIQAMTGGGDANAKIRGSYKETNEAKAMEKHLWPAAENEVSNYDVAISYQFASYNGKTLIPGWTKRLDGFSFTFDNAHGGTYIVSAYISYRTPDNKLHKLNKKGITGGAVGYIDGIPLDAKDICIDLAFEAGDSHHFRFDDPLISIRNGHCTIDTSGVWPWGTHAKIR